MKLNASSAIASVACALAILVFAVGGERISLWSYCEWWHATSDSQVSIEGLRFTIPRGWCPLGTGEGVTLSSVPLSRRDESIVVLIGTLPRYLRDHLPQLPERTKIRGEPLVLVGEASPHNLSGVPAFRMQYKPENSGALSDSYVAWLFPEHGLMISSWEIPTSKLEFFDDFVATFVDRSALRLRVDGESAGTKRDP